MLRMVHTIRSIADPYHKRILSPAEGSNIYRSLRNKAVKKGFLSPTYGYYFVMAVTDWIALTFALYFVYRSEHIILLVISSMLVGFFLVHAGGLTHDLGHRQVFRSPILNDICGMIIGGLTAIPYKVWCYNHNLHHSHPNEQEIDPDVDSYFTFVTDRPGNTHGFLGFVRRNQHVLYYPLLCFAGISFRIKGLRHLYAEFSPRPLFDIVLLAVGIAVWFTTPFFLFPLWKALIFVMVYNATAGFYLGNIFAPNHKGMPQLRPNIVYSFFEQQVITARNVKSSWLIDYVFLGLEYQVEHHLFPGASRMHLKNLHRITSPVCRTQGMPIVEMGLLDTNLFILKNLKEVAATT